MLPSPQIPQTPLGSASSRGLLWTSAHVSRGSAASSGLAASPNFRWAPSDRSADWLCPLLLPTSVWVFLTPWVFANADVFWPANFCLCGGVTECAFSDYEWSQPPLHVSLTAIWLPLQWVVQSYPFAVRLVISWLICRSSLHILGSQLFLSYHSAVSLTMCLYRTKVLACDGGESLDVLTLWFVFYVLFKNSSSLDHNCILSLALPVSFTAPSSVLRFTLVNDQFVFHTWSSPEPMVQGRDSTLFCYV